MSNLRNRLASMNKKASGLSYMIRTISDGFYMMKNIIEDLQDNYEEILKNDPELVKNINEIDNLLDKINLNMIYLEKYIK